MKFKVGDRDVTTTLVIKPQEDGPLSAEWQSQWGEHEVTDVAYERGDLAFKRTSKFQDRQWESTFEGQIRGATLSGVMKSEMGEIPVEVARSGLCEFVLRRWPAEVDRGLRDAFETGRAIPIVRADISVGSSKDSLSINETMKQAVFRVPLSRGEVTIRATFTTESGETVGAYFTGVRRISDSD